MADGFSLRGVVTPIITPFRDDGELYEDSLCELVQFQLRSKVNGLFVLGTTGLGPAIRSEVRRRVAEVVVEEAKGKVPVIVQAGATDSKVSFELAAHAERIGADAVASLTPFYYRVDDEAIARYFDKFTQATTLPVLIYNIPQNTGNNVTGKLLGRLIENHSIVGIKDSSGDFLQLLDYLQVAPEEFNILVGADSFFFSALCAGAKGVVSGVANAFPEIFVEIYQAYLKGDYAKARRLQLKAHAIRSAVRNPPVAPLMEALRLRGLKSGAIKSPLRPLNQTEKTQLHDSLKPFLQELNLAI